MVPNIFKYLIINGNQRPTTDKSPLINFDYFSILQRKVLTKMTSSKSLTNSPPLSLTAKNYLTSLLNKDRQHAEEIITKAIEDGVSIKDVYLKIFQPAQWEIGRLWQTNKITVAMEHYCTAATQFIMSRLYDHIFATEKNGKSMVATSISGELHELGIRMVSDFFEMEGWNTFYLGANTPGKSIVDMIKEVDADILAISATIYFNIPQVADLISYIKSETETDKLKILVGGKAFNSYHDLWQQVNADGYASDAEGAVTEAYRLIN